jgi:hypothetical protein
MSELEALDRGYSPAGGTADYNSGNPHLLSAIITKITGTSALEYAKTKLFGLLGITNVSWQHDPQGISVGGYGLSLQPRDMAKIGFLYLRKASGKVSNCFRPLGSIRYATPRRTCMTLGSRNFGIPTFSGLCQISTSTWRSVNHGQVIMVLPDLDIVMVKTGRGWCRLDKLADLVSSSVKSDTSLPADTANAKLMANKILDVSTEKPTEVGPTSKMAAIISGKVYWFPPNEINLRSLSLILTGPQPHYDIETYALGTTKSGVRFSGPIGLDGLYRKGELT